MRRTLSLFAVGSIATFLTVAPAHAIVVSPTNNAAALQAALLGLGGIGINVTGFTVSGACGATCQTGTFTNASNTYGISDGIVLSSGSVADYADGANTIGSKTTNYSAPASAAQEALLDPITGSFNHFDAVQIDITFDVLPGYNNIYFGVVFGSEEYAEYVNSQYVDGFGLYLNGTNIAFVGGLPVNINHPGFGVVPGTELDGILPYAVFSGGVTSGSTGNTLTFILSDTSDAVLDSTAYITAFGGTPPPIPEPSTVLLLGAGLVGLYVGRGRLNRG